MDDLLALMEDGDNVAHLPMRDHSFTDNTADESVNMKTTAQSTLLKNIKVLHTKEKQLGSTVTNTPSASVDERIGIRLSNHAMSSDELSDLLSIYAFYSAPALSAMSLVALNRLLVEPASAIVDVTTVCGTMKVTTVGIVFSNTGTRISSSGNAFCMLSIGNLTAGRCVTVLLFGQAYSSVSRLCVPGKVVGLNMPSLLPSKTYDHGSTILTLSVNTNDQIQIIADARDYGTCRAILTGRGGFRINHCSNSKEPSDGPRKCKNFIDKRNGEYCTVHKKLAHTKNSTMTNGKDSLTFIGSLKLQSQQQRMQQTFTRPVASSQNAILNGFKRHNEPSAIVGNETRQHALNPCDHRTRPASSHSGILNPAKKPKVQPCDTGGTRSQQAWPKTTNKAIQEVTSKHHGIPSAPLRSQNDASEKKKVNKYSRETTSEKIFITNPQTLLIARSPHSAPVHMFKERLELNQCKSGLAQKELQNKVNTRSTDATKGTEMSLKRLIQEGTKRRTPLVPKKDVGKNRGAMIVNTDKDGFDGSVPVPKPSKRLFGRGRSFPDTATAANNTAAMMLQNRAKFLADDVRARQRQVAKVLRNAESQPSHGLALSSNTFVKRRDGRQSLTSQTLPSQPSFLEDKEFDFDKLMTAQSRFSNQLNAEEYVKSRHVVSELEQKEENLFSKTQKPDSDPAILKEWHCAVCERAFSSRPLACIRANHSVTLNRSVKQTETLVEKREKLTNTEASQGGLVLATGLEWSRYRFN